MTSAASSSATHSVKFDTTAQKAKDVAIDTLHRPPFFGLEQHFAFDQDESLQHKAELIKLRQQSSMLYWSIKRTVKAELIKSKYAEQEAKELIPKILEQQNLKVKMQNEIFRLFGQANHSATGFSKMDHEQLDASASKKRKKLRSPSSDDEQVGRIASIQDVAAYGGIVLIKEGDDRGILQVPAFALDDAEDKIDVVNHARNSWIEFIKEQILSISGQLGIPLAVCLNLQEKENKKKRSRRKKNRSQDMFEIGGGSGTPEPEIGHNTSFSDMPPNAFGIQSQFAGGNGGKDTSDMPNYTGVFGPSNLFEVCIKIQNPNHERMLSANAVGWGLIKLQLKSPDRKVLRKMFEELDPIYRQCGVDDERREWYNRDILNLAKQVGQSNLLPVVCKFCRRGCPLSLRPQLWKQMLNVQSTPQDKRYYDALVQESKRTQYLVDDMVANDVKRTCDDENYFVFEDELQEAMRAFSRDPWIRNNSSLKPLMLFGVDDLGRSSNIAYPPSGVIPFEGLSLLAAPLAYLYSNVEDIYYAFRGLYCKHLCRLHTVSSEPDTLLSLCKLFEDLLQEKDPQLFYHLLQMNIHPLSIAFHWIFHGFAGYLNVHELLLLWDRILGFGNLHLLPVLAASIFWLRSKFLMKWIWMLFLLANRFGVDVITQHPKMTAPVAPAPTTVRAQEASQQHQHSRHDHSQKRKSVKIQISDSEQELVDILLSGEQMYKVPRGGLKGLVFRKFYVTEDLKYLAWDSHKPLALHKERKIKLSDVETVLRGQQTELFRKAVQDMKQLSQYEQASFSLVCSNPHRTLDLICEDPMVVETYVRGLQILVQYNRREFEVDDRQDLEEADAAADWVHVEPSETAALAQVNRRKKPFGWLFKGKRASGANASLPQPSVAATSEAVDVGKQLSDHAAAVAITTTPAPVPAATTTSSGSGTSTTASTAQNKARRKSGSEKKKKSRSSGNLSEMTEEEVARVRLELEQIGSLWDEPTELEREEELDLNTPFGMKIPLAQSRSRSASAAAALPTSSSASSASPACSFETSEDRKLFEFVVVVSVQEKGKTLVPYISYSFPIGVQYDKKHSHVLGSIPLFCFPDIDGIQKLESLSSKTYSFVLTDIDGSRRFGYCRRVLPAGDGPRYPISFCIVSAHPCFGLFSELLDYIEARNRVNSVVTFQFIKQVLAQPFPERGSTFQMHLHSPRSGRDDIFTYRRPITADPMLEYVDFSKIFSVLSIDDIIQLFTSVLFERHVVLLASDIQVLSECALAAISMTYPFVWHHTFIPILPSKLLDMVCSPVPFVIGVFSTHQKALEALPTEDLVLVNLDSSYSPSHNLTRPGQISASAQSRIQNGIDLSILPKQALRDLQQRLKSISKTRPIDNKLVSIAFTSFLVQVLGDYRRFIRADRFDTDAYIEHQSKSDKQFYTALRQSQGFLLWKDELSTSSVDEAASPTMFETVEKHIKERRDSLKLVS